MIEDSTTDNRPAGAKALGTRKHAFVVLNPKSGSADVGRLRQLLTGRLDEHGWVYDVYEMTGDEDVAAIVRRSSPAVGCLTTS